VRRLLVTANVLPSSPIFVTLLEALTSSDTSVLTRVTRRNVPENIILYIKAVLPPWWTSAETLVLPVGSRTSSH
jgi:hypothetical protein